MKKISKSAPPNKLTIYKTSHPDGSWEGFRNHNSGDDYKEIKQQIFYEQGCLCAYCESSLLNRDSHQRRIEHFHDKEDMSDPQKNWGLSWNNILGVCIGGQDQKNQYALPDNLSCDAYKNHLKLKKLLLHSLLNPLQVPAFPCLFRFDKRTGYLEPHDTNCSSVTILNNQSTIDLVKNTIETFNLNCDRLCKQRLEVLYEYERLIKRARNKNNKQIFSQLSKHWLEKPWKSFFTTRRCLLGQHAENQLRQLNFNG